MKAELKVKKRELGRSSSVLQELTLTVHIIFKLIDPALDSEELEAKTQNLLWHLREFDAVG